MTFFSQTMVTGILIGSLYALVALGVVLIYKACRVFNFASGMFVLLGAYEFYTFFVMLHWPLWLSVLLTLLSALIMGVVVQRLFIKPLLGQAPLSLVMVTLGFMYLLNGLILMVWSPITRTLPEFIPLEALNLGELVVSQQFLWILAISVICFVAFVLFFQRTDTGLGMRALAEDHQLARSTGIKVMTLMAIAWSIGAALAAVTGILLSSLHGSIDTLLGDVGLKGIPVVFLGGLESIKGCAIAGIVVGVLETIAAGYLDPLVGGGMSLVVPYIILMIAVIIRPQGLFGLERIERI